VLVLSPTRELASQIAESFRTYGRHVGITVGIVFGGVAHKPQIQTLARGVDVLVATPGRLMDLMEQRCADISGTEIFVLDEADQMLDLGFVKPIRRIVSHMSHRRQNLFFSATMPGEIAGLADELLKNPVKVSVAPVATTAERVRQRVILIETSKKRALLAQLLADPEMTRTLVFTRTKRGADRVARHLEGAGMKAAAIHGNKSQRQREITLEDFKQSRINVLVATDIAARGIDIDLVSHVVNYELPEVPEAYVHRIGRTARAGASGIAISLCDAEERDQLRAIERLTRQQIPHEDRRNDTSIIADKTPPRRDDGERATPHRGQRSHNDKGGAQSPRRGHQANGGRGRPERAEGRSEGRQEGRRTEHRERGQEAHREHAPAERREHSPGGHRGHAQAAPRERGHGEHRHRADEGVRAGGGERRGQQRHHDHARDGEPRSLRDVGFLARSNNAPRADRNGGQERPRRPAARSGSSPRGRDAG
jgi:ATP-dependent RNA helicase RhlE